jgi:adenylyl-sulfate kinase
MNGKFNMKKYKKNKGLVIWLTGLPCSGKTTISKKLEKYFKDKNIPVQRLDGNVLRKTISSDLGFSKKDRDENIKRVAYLAKILAEKNINVIVAFVSPYRKIRNFARKICPNFIEVYVKCAIGECIKRDNKGEYRKALAGKIKNFTGIQDPYEEPKKAEVVLDTLSHSLKDNLNKLIRFIIKE